VSRARDLPEPVPAAVGLPGGPRLAVLVVIGASTYVGLLAWRSSDLLAELRTTIRRRT